MNSVMERKLEVHDRYSINSFSHLQEFLYRKLQRDGYYLEDVELGELRGSERDRFFVFSLDMWKQYSDFTKQFDHAA